MLPSMITVTILSKNSAATLSTTLDSTTSFAEVLLLDTGSTDATLQIASRYSHVQIVQTKFDGFGKTHNEASSLASHDWILSLDSDEVLSPPLLASLQTLQLDPHCVYSIQRKNYLRGKWIRWCGGWHPDWVVRLYNRKSTRFSDDAVHEKVLTSSLSVTPLIGYIEHTPYRSVSDFLIKMETYSTLFVQQHRKTKRSSVLKALLHGACAFWKSYLFKRGFLGGAEGLVISLYNGHTAFYKYLKLAWERLE